MKERPIIMSTESVRGILAGRKTQTRRVIKPQPESKDGMWWIEEERDDKAAFAGWYLDDNGLREHLGEDWYGGGKHMPYGGVYEGGGDRLWVREEFMPISGDPDVCHYRADEDPEIARIADEADLWQCAMYMPRAFSRIDLELTDVRVQRVQEISEEDAIAEGEIDGGCINCGNSSFPEPCGCDNPQPDHIDAYIWTWNQLNTECGLSWDYNPWVWALTFKIV